MERELVAPPGEETILRLAAERSWTATLADPTDGVVLFFRGPGPEAAERFARNDPYVIHGLVTEWRVREWTTVVEDDLARPTRPEDA